MVQQIPAIAHPLALWLRCLAREAKLYLHLARTLVVLAGLILVVSMYSVWSQTSFFDKLLIFVIFALMWVMMFMIRAFHKVLGVQYSWETWLREQWNSRRRLRMIMHPTFHAHPELKKLLDYTPEPWADSDNAPVRRNTREKGPVDPWQRHEVEVEI